MFDIDLLGTGEFADLEGHDFLNPEEETQGPVGLSDGRVEVQHRVQAR